LRRDLDWIVLRALEKERSRRYFSAADLARDIERHLRGEPVEAAPPSLGYKLGKYARRHRAALATVAALLLVLVAATVMSTWQAVRARRAEKLATQAAQEEAVARQREENQQRKAETLAQAEAEARRRVEAESRRAYRFYYAAQMNLLPRDWEGTNIGASWGV